MNDFSNASKRMDEEMSTEDPTSENMSGTSMAIDNVPMGTTDPRSRSIKSFHDSFVRKHENKMSLMTKIRRKLAQLSERPRSFVKSRRWIISVKDVTRYPEVVTYLRMVPGLRYYRTVKLWKTNGTFKYRIYCIFNASTGLYRELLPGSNSYRCTVSHHEVMEVFDMIRDQIEEYGNKEGTPEYRGLDDKQLLEVPDRNDLCYRDQLRYIRILIDKLKTRVEYKEIPNKKVYFVSGKEEVVNNWMKEQLKDTNYDSVHHLPEGFTGLSMDNTITKLWYYDFNSREMDIEDFLTLIIPVVTYFNSLDYDHTVPMRYDTIYITSLEDPENLYKENAHLSEIMHRFMTEVYVNDDGSVRVVEPRPDTNNIAAQFALKHDKICN